MCTLNTKYSQGMLLQCYKIFHYRILTLVVILYLNKDKINFIWLKGLLIEETCIRKRIVRTFEKLSHVYIKITYYSSSPKLSTK